MTPKKHPALKKCPKTKKICYSSEEEVKEKLQLIHFWGLIWRHETGYYQCPHCQEWHMTSQDKPNPKEKKKKGESK
jgi:hypothetical protein